MKSNIFYFFTVFICLFFAFNLQIIAQSNTEDKILEKKNQIISDYYFLNNQTVKLNSPISKAYSKTVIADGLWELDIDKAKQILTQALEMTFPEKDEKKAKSEEIAKGLNIPSKIDISRKMLQTKIFQIALRDKNFSKKLVELIDKNYAKDEKSANYSKLAQLSIESNDLSSAENFILLAIQTENFDLNLASTIYFLATKSREKADKLILKAIEFYKVKPLTKQVTEKLIYGLDIAVFAEEIPIIINNVAQVSDIETIKLFLQFSLDKISELGQSNQNNLRDSRGTILSLWRRVNTFAPELKNRIEILEQLSRINSKEDSLPETISSEAQQAIDDEIVTKAEKSKKDNDIIDAIKVVLRKNNFNKARELANLFKNSNQTKRYVNQINFQESTSLIDKGELYEAEKIAQKIEDPRFILQVYSILIGKFYEKKEIEYAKNLTYETVRRLRSFDENLSLPYSLSKLSKSIVRIDKDLAISILDETIKSLNKKNLDEELGEVDFDIGAFIEIAKINLDFSEQMAESLSNNLRRIVVLASIYKHKQKQLLKK
jgi:hypothetical protein